MKKLLLKIARIPALGKLVGWVVKYFGSLLPLKKVVDNREIIVFHHPMPSSSVHLLAMLKAQVPDVRSITPQQFSSVLSAASEAAKKLNLSAPHILVLTNGGRFQEVKQLHFHIYPSETSPESDIRAAGTKIFGGIQVREYMRGDSAQPNLLIADVLPEDFPGVLPAVCNAYAENGRGYRVFCDLNYPGKIYIRLENREPAA